MLPHTALVRVIGEYVALLDGIWIKGGACVEALAARVGPCCHSVNIKMDPLHTESRTSLHAISSQRGRPPYQDGSELAERGHQPL